MRLLTTSLLVASLLTPWSAGRAQASPLSLGDALDRAARHAFANRASRGAALAAATAPVVALRGVLPSVRVDAGLVRTNDPIGAFGTTLRQRAITAQDFDPARLNYPAAVSNYTSAMVVEQPLFNADAWIGRRAASRVADAARAGADWTAVATSVDVVRAYFGVVLAHEKVAALGVAVRAAREHVRRAEQMAKNGLVTPSDAMLASVKAGEVEAMLLEAEGEAANAKLALSTLLGAPGDTAFTLPGGLPDGAAIRDVAQAALAATPIGERDDVAAARASADAATADAWRARSLYLPRINGFARYDWNSALRPYGGEKNWTIGVIATWSIFTGASELADIQATSARLSAATAMREGAEAKARLEVAQSANAIRTAVAKLAIAERAVEQGVAAHRIVTRKYQGGLSPIVELLDAAAIETQSRLGVAAARYALIVTTAERRRAVGLDPAAVRALDAAPAVARQRSEF